MLLAQVTSGLKLCALCLPAANSIGVHLLWRCFFWDPHTQESPSPLSAGSGVTSGHERERERAGDVRHALENPAFLSERVRVCICVYESERAVLVLAGIGQYGEIIIMVSLMRSMRQRRATQSQADFTVHAVDACGCSSSHRGGLAPLASVCRVSIARPSAFREPRQEPQILRRGVGGPAGRDPWSIFPWNE